MKISHPKKIFIFSIILLILFLVWFFWDEYAAPQVAVFQKTEDWTHWGERIPEGETDQHLQSNDPATPMEIKSGIFLRTDSSNNLLLKHNYGKDIFLYDANTKAIRKVTEADWSGAGSEITICKSQRELDYNQAINAETYLHYLVTLNGSRFETYGKYPLQAVESPTHTKAAILSAYGPLYKGFGIGWIGLGGGEPVVYGRRYVQIIQLNSRQDVRKPIRLAELPGKYEFYLCWSQDERYVVAYKPYENFSIIETNITNK